MKNIHYYIVASVIVVVLAVVVIFMVSDLSPDATPPQQENETPLPTVEETIRPDTSYIEIRTIDGRRVILYPEDQRYPAIEAECREQVQGINGQLKTGFSRRELDAMKRNGTSVTIHFSEPTHFVTSYIVDGSPKEITIEEALFFLDYEDDPNMVITPSQNGSGVWTTSRDRSKLAALATQVLVEEGRSGEKVSTSPANLTFAPVDFQPMPETVPLYRLETPEVTKEMFSEMAEALGLEGTVREAYDQFVLEDGVFSLEMHMQSGRVAMIDISRWVIPNDKDLPENLPSDEEAVEIATEYLEEKGLMPPDAVLLDVQHPHIITSNENGEVIGIAYEAIQVSFCREVDGREVAGSELTVDVGGGGDVIGVYKLWRDCVEEREVEVITPEEAFEEVKALGVPNDPMKPQTAEITEIDLGYYEAQAMEAPAYLVPVYIFSGEVTDESTTTPFVRYVAAAPEFRGEVPLVKAAS
ncbi:hypothetical protein [Methanofollis aquaemaris]|uniref:hypothetical protein n=1 Tax=Methanofollis aquaemaris TaxID=126734 RepID=UPI00223F5F3B|nr:hypothetical protein [Methanofollis aquaemaris]